MREKEMRRSCISVVAFMVFGACSGNADAEGPIRFAPLPLEGRKVIHEQFRGLVDYLTETTGRTFEWKTFSDYGEIIAAFRAGEIDLAYLGPLPFVILARETSAAHPLCCFRDIDGTASYTCSLVAFGASNLTSDRLHGVRFGLTQPYSTCGYLAATEMLAGLGNGLDQQGNNFAYAGSHSKAALGVVRGQYDVASVKTAIADRYAHLDLHTLATSQAYPGFTMAANADTLDPETIDQLRSALLALDPHGTSDLAARMAGWGPQLGRGTVPATQCDYGAIEKTLKTLPWPIPGTAP